VRVFALTIAFVVGLSAVAFADDDGDLRWGISLWGLSYHVNRTIGYDKVNPGLGLRFYLNRYVFLEGDALRNSNRGITLPASVGIELGIGSLPPPCRRIDDRVLPESADEDRLLQGRPCPRHGGYLRAGEDQRSCHPQSFPASARRPRRVADDPPLVERRGCDVI
jgi:hypothetical protein